MIALHKILVDAEIGEVDENAVEQHHPEGRLGQAWPEVAQAELVCLNG